MEKMVASQSLSISPFGMFGGGVCNCPKMMRLFVAANQNNIEANPSEDSDP